jgi:mRNA-degrading endonuclease toxin of MazEF toxin-antitoxin module
VCTVLALTTAIKPSRLAVELPLHVTGRRCQILPWQIMTVSQSRLEEFVAMLDSAVMEQVENSLRVVWRL